MKKVSAVFTTVTEMFNVVPTPLMGVNDSTARMMTFKNWPNPKISTLSLNLSGFYYLDRYDVVKCVTCGGMIAKWKDDDNPWERHERLFPDCRRFSVFRKKTEDKPNFSSMESRLRTFKAWPFADIQTPEDLAEAGFCYENFYQEVRCFSCNLIVGSWERGEVPWLQHEKFNPNCPFLHSVVASFQETDEEQMNITTENSGHVIAPVEDPSYSEQAVNPLQYYNMNHKNRGQAIIFNHEKFLDKKLRRGTQKDCADLHNALKKLGFDVTIYQDCKYLQIFQHISRAASDDHTDNDCLLIAILSHGYNGGIYAYDMPYRLDQIASCFTIEACPTLASKPKLFFIQACRGENHEQRENGVIGGNIETDAVTSFVKSIPGHADFLYMYSTIEGFVSYRSPEHGSWFIQALVQELNETATKYDFLNVLTLVVNRVASKGNEDENSTLQLASITSRLTRILRFTNKTNVEIK